MFTFLPRDVRLPQLDGNENDDHHETKDQTRHQEDQQGWTFATSFLLVRVIRTSWEQTLCCSLHALHLFVRQLPESCEQPIVSYCTCVLVGHGLFCRLVQRCSTWTRNEDMMKQFNTQPSSLSCSKQPQDGTANTRCVLEGSKTSWNRVPFWSWWVVYNAEKIQDINRD